MRALSFVDFMSDTIDRSAFKALPKAANNRQAVYACIKRKHPETVLLRDIQKETGLTGAEVYASAKVLCVKGFATRKPVTVTRTKKNKEEEKNIRIGILYVDPWSSKLSREWR